jgi:hypothetical protein
VSVSVIQRINLEPHAYNQRHKVISFPIPFDNLATIAPEYAGCDGEKKAGPGDDVCSDLQSFRHC